MHFAVCDDTTNILGAVYSQLQIELDKYDQSIEVLAFSDPVALLHHHTSYPFDALFLDIEMPVINGFEILKKLNDRHDTAKTIFVTSYEGLIAESRWLRPFGCVYKGNLQLELPKVVGMLFQTCFRDSNVLFKPLSSLSVKLNDILYMEGEHNDTTVHLRDQAHMIKCTLKSVEKTIAHQGFIRIHKNYMVNFKYIFKLNAHEAIMDGGCVLPVGQRWAERANKMYREMLVKNSIM